MDCMYKSTSCPGQCCFGQRRLQQRWWSNALRQRASVAPRALAGRRAAHTIRALTNVSQHEVPVFAPVVVNEKGMVVRTPWLTCRVPVKPEVFALMSLVQGHLCLGVQR